MLAPVMQKPDKYVIRALLGSLLHLSCQNEFILIKTYTTMTNK